MASNEPPPEPKPGERPPSDDKLRIEFRGPGVEPETLDVFAALELAGAYLELLEQVAEHFREPLKLTGLFIENKCAALAFTTDSIERAKSLAIRANRFALGDEPVPKGMGESVDRVMSMLRHMPAGYTTAIMAQDWKADLVISQSLDCPPSEATELRAVVMRVGGVRPHVRLHSVSEPYPFTLETTREIAANLAHHLYRPVDVEAILRRDVDGKIIGGIIEAFHGLTDGDVEKWRTWFAENASDWNEVDDIEGELGHD